MCARIKDYIEQHPFEKFPEDVKVADEPNETDDNSDDSLFHYDPPELLPSERDN